jgi:hypothetical protein
MTERITEYLLADHRAIEELLARSRANGFALDAFSEMRKRLLRHIAVEEKVLFPAVRARDPGALPDAGQIKIEHAALCSLLVPTPDLALANEVAMLLDQHDAREESAGGVYERCERALGDASFELVSLARAVPPVRASAYLDRPGLRRTAREALEAATRVRDR